MSPLEKIDRALDECDRMLDEYPGFSILNSVRSQLEYVRAVICDEGADIGRLKDIILGIYAAKEFEERDMEFAELLYDVEAIVDDLKRGSKRQ